MAKLYSSLYVFKILKGSHIKLRKAGDPVLTVIVPAERKENPHGTFRSILRQSQLTLKDFE